MNPATRLLSFLFSTRLTAILFIAFSIAMAVGTFVESAHNTTTARIWIYNAWWFELMMIFFVVNFAGNIKRYRLLKWEKWPLLLLHLSWILIIVGAGITRYIGFEGVMPIREGESTQQYLSEKTYLSVFIDGEIDGQPRRKLLEDDILLAEAANNAFRWKNDFNAIPFAVSYVDFISGAEETLVEDLNGEMYLKIVEAGDGNRHDHFLKMGEVASIHNILFAFNAYTDGAINITLDEANNYSIESPFEGTYLRMADQQQGSLLANTSQPLMLRTLYSTAGMQFVFPDPAMIGSYQIVPVEDKETAIQDALTIQLTANGEQEQVTVLGAKGVANSPVQVELGGLEFWITYGSKQVDLPFSIRLNDFIAEKYPGTEKSYSSFMSKVTVLDDPTFDHDIYMNHILNHKGYRFFQASFDPDEKGTVLSVNHDAAGTAVTYAGYFLLYIGLLGLMFFGKTRFKKLAKMLEDIRLKKAALTLMFFLSATSAYAQHQHQPPSFAIDSVLQADAMPVDEAAKFGALVIQDQGGRMKPANTFASELVRKVSKSDHYKSLDANQVLLSITQNPIIWYQVPFVYLKRGNDSIRSLVGVGKKAKYASFANFFDAQGNYKLAPYLEAAYKSATPNQFQKDFIETDRKVNLLFSALEGKVLRIFPVPNDENNRWVSAAEVDEINFVGVDSLYVNNVLPLYLTSLRQGNTTSDYTQADQLLESLKGYQKKYGASIIPTEDQIKAELYYNKYDIFKRLFSWYMYAGTLMFFVLIAQMLYDVRFLRGVVGFFVVVISLLFVLHTAGLAARWYISGHAPWSDAYESMIYVAWATMGMGLAFGRKSKLTIAATAFVASMVLMIAHWNWMDPEIANLVPVLDSYWLMIHVAVIVGSYGPFALGMILGVISLILILLTTERTAEKMRLNLAELTVVNELALTVGLIMLTIGNFLGGQWANESWGRYWGWDPKETWALISILVYAFVLHMRLVPGLRGKWIFSVMSVLAFASIMMTYFGVNFYLTGLHSYASGDKVITPNFVYYSLAFIVILSAASYGKSKKYFSK